SQSRTSSDCVHSRKLRRRLVGRLVDGSSSPRLSFPWKTQQVVRSDRRRSVAGIIFEALVAGFLRGQLGTSYPQKSRDKLQEVSYRYYYYRFVRPSYRGASRGFRSGRDQVAVDPATKLPWITRIAGPVIHRHVAARARPSYRGSFLVIDDLLC